MALHRVAGVHEQVQKNLIELAGVTANPRQVAVFANYGDAVFELGLHQAQSAIEFFVQVGVLKLGLIHARKCAQVLHDFLYPMSPLATSRQQLRDGGANLLRVGTRVLSAAQLVDELIEKLQVGVHEANRVVEFVRDTGHELPQRAQLFALHQLQLDLLQFRRARFNPRFQGFVKLRDFVERFCVLHRDRTLIGEGSQELPVFGRKRLARKFAPHGNHAQQVDSEQNGNEQLDFEGIKDVPAKLALFGVQLFVEVCSVEFFAPHP